jgi:hypothetical protein
MRGARYVRLIPWALHSGSEQYSAHHFVHGRISLLKLVLSMSFYVRAIGG